MSTNPFKSEKELQDYLTNHQARTFRRYPGGAPPETAGTESGPPTCLLMITIPGSIRSKKNSRRPIIIGGKNVKRRAANIPSKAYEVYEQQARIWARVQYRGQPITEPIAVTARFFYRGNRMDLQGAMESIADAMEGILWENDRQIESWDGSRMIHCKDNPRTEIEVRSFR